ncbi:hypothetical protein HGM15179_016348 [Zosterops borbonicus]|uniref:Uncharacterized protein n=1 Tax=Zosterops borbonicus TaxID=364589 RepID=A0A8K1G2S0_9PASS|nr:hypothetical protein HGM15179_016348 [Zosterops borbonicus]
MAQIRPSYQCWSPRNGPDQTKLPVLEPQEWHKSDQVTSAGNSQEWPRSDQVTSAGTPGMAQIRPSYQCWSPRNGTDQTKLPVLGIPRNGTDQTKLPVLGIPRNGTDQTKLPVLGIPRNGTDQTKLPVLEPQEWHRQIRPSYHFMNDTELDNRGLSWTGP